MSDCRTDSLMFELKGFDPVRDDGASWEMMLRWRQSWFKDRALPWGVEDGIWVFKNPSIFLENKIIGHTFKMTIENVERKKDLVLSCTHFQFSETPNKFPERTAAKQVCAQRAALLLISRRKVKNKTDRLRGRTDRPPLGTLFDLVGLYLVNCWFISCFYSRYPHLPTLWLTRVLFVARV